MTTSGQIKCHKCGGVIGGSVDRCECPLSARYMRGRFAGPFEISVVPPDGPPSGTRATGGVPENNRLTNRLGAAGAQLQGHSREVATRQLSSDPDRGLFIVGMVCVVLSIIGAIVVFVMVFAP